MVESILCVLYSHYPPYPHYRGHSHLLTAHIAVTKTAASAYVFAATSLSPRQNLPDSPSAF